MKEVTALVTGGGSGIGKAIAERILSKGGRVAIVDLHAKKSETFQQFGNNVLFIKADVTSEEDVMRGLEAIREQFGSINVVINSAGIVKWCVPYDFEANVAHPLEIYNRVMNVNALGTFNVTRLAVGVMATNVPDKNHQRGVIINIASVMADDPRDDLVAYAISKAAVAGMTLPFARSFAEKSIRVVCISPGYTKTPLSEPFADKEKTLCQANLFPKRMATSDEIAHLMQCVIENPYINGENIKINAGYHWIP